MKRTQLSTALIAAILLVLVPACTPPGGPDKIKVGFAPPDAAAVATDDGGVTPVQSSLTCMKVVSSQMYPPRSSVTSGQASGASATYFTADLFGRFKAICGGCHVDNSLGNFTVSEGDFAGMVTQAVVDQITGKDTTKPYMPPAASGYPPYSQRSPTDPVVRLVVLLNEWLAQGSPQGAFIDESQAVQGASAAYTISPDMGARMTNIGTCVPGKDMVGSSLAAMDDKDAFFASATELPHTLDKTDLVTLDSDELAKNGVISFAPTYPLWTDNAGKMRYVRVPRGQSITFDKATQQFHIPPNTRFYKTFLKQMVDVSGHPAWRKMETRVIVSRPDMNGPDGRALAQTALYGTYIWSDDETSATLLDDPLRDGKPFADRIVTYVLDEQKAQAVADTKPENLQRALSNAGLLRHYAFPGSRRCVDCHMGSSSQSFVLGFTPLQLARRSTGGGLYEPATGDELTQLERLIQYGVISGMTSQDDVLPLEASEGTRAARTPEELAAQAYMVGNCAHCHNPRGLPLVKEPLLVDKVDFFPSPTGGIFEFPLDRMSPIRFRGLEQGTPVPYITPSLYDLPVDSAQLKAYCPGDPNYSSGLLGDCYKSGELPHWILAPWRSLVYRNVDTPFDYFEDYLPYPHMPMHSPGYDCRAPKIMGDWMVSIPAKLIDTTTREDAYLSDTASPGTADPDHFSNPNEDNQPYREVTPDSPDYPAAALAARARLDQYHAGPRYNFCPSTYTDDVIDPVVDAVVEQHGYVESDTGYFTDPNDPTKVVFPEIKVPIRPNYIPFDDTDPPGDWFPRNPLWDPGIVDPTQIDTVVKETITNGDPQATEDLTNVLQQLPNAKLTDEIRTQLLQEVPMGLWNTKPGCNFDGVPKVSDAQFAGAARPDWMTLAKAPDSAPVYMESAGAAVFTTICYNCHGVMADSKGLLADAIVNFTGGDARVADFRDGLFGPVSSPGTNRARVFGDDATKLGVTSDDLAVRYMAYMALGGTQKHIPQEILDHVAATPVFGQERSNLLLVGSPDMLQIGLLLCSQIAGASVDFAPVDVSDLQGGRIRWSEHTGLIDTTGDAELWLKLCSLDNRPVVHVIDQGNWKDQDGKPINSGSLQFTAHSEYWGDAKDATGKLLYPTDAPVMDHHGQLHDGITADNPFPICVNEPDDPAAHQIADAVRKSIAVGGPGGTLIPYCPPGFVTLANKLDDGGTTFPDAKKWAARGTINAAMAVFLYLDQIERDPTKRKPLYTQCDQLGASP